MFIANNIDDHDDRDDHDDHDKHDDHLYKNEYDDHHDTNDDRNGHDNYNDHDAHDLYDDTDGDECGGLIKEEHDEFCLFLNAFDVRMHFFFKSYLQLRSDLVFKLRISWC